MCALVMHAGIALIHRHRILPVPCLNIREPLGHGTILNMPVMPDGYRPALLISAAPGAFLAMAVVVWIVRSIWPAPESAEHPEVR